MHEITNNIKLSRVALNLRKLRLQRKCSIASVAQGSKVNTETVFDYENDRRTPKIHDLKRLAKFFGVKLDDIFYA